MADKQPNICVTFTLDRQLHATLTKWAKEDDRPLAYLVRQILRREVERSQEQKQKAH